MQHYSHSLFYRKKQFIFLAFGLVAALVLSFATFKFEMLAPAALIGLSVFIIYSVFLFKNPRIGFITLIIYCFTSGLLGREAPGLPYGIGIEIFLLLTWIAALTYYKKQDWRIIRNDLCLLFLLWFIYSVLQVLNPAGASVRGWLQEIRGVALYPVLMIPLCFMVFRKKDDLGFFLKLILILSFIAAINGIRQVHLGLTSGEIAFINSPEGATHMIWGNLRAFSFYDAGQFGAFQAVMVVVSVILALSTEKIMHKIILLFFAGIFAYAMLASGTRGALFALVVTAFSALFLSKNFKILILGFIVILLGLAMLKFTSIGSNYYSVQRFRTSLDINDPSLNVRFITQRKLREYLKTRPLGGGLGVLGAYSVYNQDKYLSTIPPDSYWVKIWAMCGIVGLTIWFSMLMYIQGKCCGIIWKIQDKKLKIRLIAIFSASAGIFFCSYGNEVINNMPSSLIVCVTWVFVYLGPRTDKMIAEENAHLPADLDPDHKLI